MAVDTQYAIGTLMFLMHENEFRSARIKRIVIDETGQHYVFNVDNQVVEKSVKDIAKSKEDLFNLLVNKFAARQNK